MCALKNWNIEAITGYKPFTTYYTDFSIAERFGTAGINDTYRRAKASWKNNVRYFTEIVMVLNWKIWEHHEKNPDLAELYTTLYEEADSYAMEHFKGDDLQYFLRTTD